MVREGRGVRESDPDCEMFLDSVQPTQKNYQVPRSRDWQLDPTTPIDAQEFRETTENPVPLTSRGAFMFARKSPLSRID